MQELKMSRKLPGFWVLLLLSLTSAYATRTPIRKLNSISELKTNVPQSNILELLHWFANELNTDNCNDIQLTFNPELEYGSHYYSNFNELLVKCPWGYKYYTVGNLHRDSLQQLPAYVRNARRRTIGWGRARIVFTARGSNGRWTIRQVYITQHVGTSVRDGTEYDPEHTYEITTNLLRQFRALSILQIQQRVTAENTSAFLQVSSNSNQNDYVSQYNLRPAAQISSFGYTSTHSQGSYYSHQNYRPQYNTASSDEGVVLCILGIALALFFIFVLIFLVKSKI
ncbi:uncharacterized protein LOC105933017 [Fundulus heteroclitus]|uniref:uncharacterized protein LOC105933017 n=1 Tax=Fundulus heteroclitus TaxID=8078 RepID=UPI00165B160B|nr:uncharacterized protein LOC105933017 [Fundulus heteroclitus]